MVAILTTPPGGTVMACAISTIRRGTEINNRKEKVALETE